MNFVSQRPGTVGEYYIKRILIFKTKNHRRKWISKDLLPSRIKPRFDTQLYISDSHFYLWLEFKYYNKMVVLSRKHYELLCYSL